MLLYEYIRRIGKSRGFGIQSPWAFNFVRDVIMEKLPYYKYSEIEAQYLGRHERKMQKLYFRVRNFVHNKDFSILDLTSNSIDDVQKTICTYGKDGCVILENLYTNDDTTLKWKTLKDSDSIGITFDLYCCAICFMPNDMYKQHYKLNF